MPADPPALASRNPAWLSASLVLDRAIKLCDCTSILLKWRQHGRRCSGGATTIRDVSR
jgi:hypothetical protein